MSDRSLMVRKADGTVEPFEPFKLQASLLKSGAKPAVVDNVVAEILRDFKPNTSTGYIYRQAFSLLKNEERSIAAKYSLKRAIADLGPSGFPFEHLLARVFTEKGYQTRTGLIVQGKCIPHEIDVLAVKDDEVIFIEAKFHNDESLKSNSKDALYVKARYDDLTGVPVNFSDSVGDVIMTSGMLITNTKFSKSASRFAECQGLTFIGWSYPRDNSLQQLIESSQLHPITSLTTLSNSQKKILLDKEIIICQDLLSNLSVLREVGVSQVDQDIIKDEIESLFALTG